MFCLKDTVFVCLVRMTPRSRTDGEMLTVVLLINIDHRSMDDIAAIFLGGDKHELSFVIIKSLFAAIHIFRSEMQSCVAFIIFGISVKLPDSCFYKAF